ncbi:MAG: type II toxin-antitoxin system prevent-host-death family antitoxin [Oscillospiraceae bacterium]|nr:type II toxin-antitoxin system prevent-host-death family antitoxin [Oscillospiraceae bacterium]
MYNVHVRPVRDLRNNYTELSEIVRNHDQVIITNNGKGEAVLINIDEYAAFEEYSHKRYVAKMLAEAEVEAANPNSERISHEDFWREFGL